MLILLSWHWRFYTSMLIISFLFMYNYNTVSGKASLHDEAMTKLAIATGHMLHVCKFLMICNIQIDAIFLVYHDQLPWLPCH